MSLWVDATPGAVIGADEVACCKENLSDLSAVEIGESVHFLPEDKPEEIGVALSRWFDDRT